MNQQESKDLIERVGGLEAAKDILWKQPEQAKRLAHTHYIFWTGSDYKIFGSGATVPQTWVEIDELREAVDKNHGIAIGDFVVFRQPGNSTLYKVLASHKFNLPPLAHITGFLVKSESGSEFPILIEFIRKATAEEEAAGHRIEQRPHPCASCPNVGHKACCCEVA